MGYTVIQVPGPSRSTSGRASWEPSGIGALEETTVCAHITLLGPFVHRSDVTTELLATLQGLMGSVAACRFELSTVARFASGLVYLSPEPAAPFRDITAMWPRLFRTGRHTGAPSSMSCRTCPWVQICQRGTWSRSGLYSRFMPEPIGWHSRGGPRTRSPPSPRSSSSSDSQDRNRRADCDPGVASA